MDCESCGEIVVRGLAGEAAPPELDAARVHAAECAACGETSAQLEVIWGALGSWQAPAAPLDSAARLAGQLALLSAAERRGSPGPWRWAALVAAALAGVLVGVVGTASRPIIEDREPTFVLLLRRGPGAVDPVDGPVREQMVAEYSAWRSELDRSGVLRGSRLLDADAGLLLRGRTVAADGVLRDGAGESVSGFYLVAAEDLRAAGAIARTSPHLQYGGSIEVRPTVEPPRAGGR
jgi:hypothetical protein